MAGKTLIALTNIHGKLEAWYAEGEPPNYTTEEIDRPTLDRLYNQNMATYQGLRIVDGCHMYRYQSSTEQDEAAIVCPPDYMDVDPLVYDPTLEAFRS